MTLRAACAAALVLAGTAARAEEADWPAYGRAPGGGKYSPAAEITPANVASLVPAWQFRTGDMAKRGRAMHQSAFEATPILTDGSLVFCTPFNEVIALDPATGDEHWRYDPQIPTEDVYPANQFVCRGVTQWRDEAAEPAAACASRIFMGTNDHRLIALDARDGEPCAGFGVNGEVKIDPGMELRWPGEFQITSPPAVVRDVVIVGSAISDNVRVEAPKGTVRAFSARDGRPLWTFDPLLRAPDGAPPAGHANVWAPMSVDEARGLVLLPTSSPSPDFYGGMRPGDGAHANSVVALDAATGAVVWSFQTVHHDVWDYDVPAQPTLATVEYGGTRREAVIQGTKMGLIFTLDAATGAPLIPVEERPVPASGVPGETLSPTQPFPVAPPPLVPPLDKTKAWGVTMFDRGACETALAKLRYDGLYTPPSLQGTAVYPFTGGGINWGGIAFDPERQILVTNTMRMVHEITLIPRDDLEAEIEAHPGAEYGRQRGAPYGMRRLHVVSPIGAPCNAPPWGMIHAIDMRTGEIIWEKPFGTGEDIMPLGRYIIPDGVPNLGGPLVTASGLIFIGATMDNYLRAFDIETGAELWRGRLPAGGQATPMTYVWEGRQYVVIAAGGYSKVGTTLGDYVIAYALPEKPPGSR